MEAKYQRHLIYQASAFFLNVEIEPGPGFAHVQKVSEGGRLFILTARSGWYAVERLRAFFSSRRIAPIEVFNVGRVTKDRQVALLAKEFPHQRIHYIEDNAAHLAAVKDLNCPNLSLVFCARGERQPLETLQELFVSTVTAAVSQKTLSAEAWRQARRQRRCS